MSDSIFEKQAKLVVNYSIGVKKGDKVLIHGPAAAEDLITEVYKEVIIQGGAFLSFGRIRKSYKPIF